MPKTPERLAAALTPNEWRLGLVERSDLFAQLVVGKILIARTPGDRSCLIADDDAHAMMALANGALADNDTRKITREDIAKLRSIEEQMQDGLNVHAASLARAVAAKLEALLPPWPTR